MMLGNRTALLVGVVSLTSLLGCSSDGSTPTPTQPANRAPQLAGVSDQQVTVGSVQQEIITATDPDGDQLSFSVSTNPGFVSIRSVSQRGNTAAADCQIAPTSGGSFTAAIRVSDGRGGSDEQSFSILVEPENITFDPLPPAIVAEVCLRGDVVAPATVRGEIGAGDCPPDILGVFVGVNESWPLNVAQTTSMTFAIDADFDSYLLLAEITNHQDPSTWDLLAEDNDSGGNRQAKLSYRLEQAREYIIFVATYSPMEWGRYSLEMLD
jgi:hypothetical protein